MRNTYLGSYPDDWPAIARATKDEAGWKCIRCRHPFDPATGKALHCTLDCDPERGLHLRFGRMIEQDPENVEWLKKLSLTVHHFDGDKSNNRWWNRMALCNSCHLKIQSSVIPERVWLWEHSEWAKVYIGGFFAFHFKQLEIPREIVEQEVDWFLSLGQPWLYPQKPGEPALTSGP